MNLETLGAVAGNFSDSIWSPNGLPCLPNYLKHLGLDFVNYLEAVTEIRQATQSLLKINLVEREGH